MRSILWEQFPVPRRYPPKAEGMLEVSAMGGLG
jgi:hypothetical protein